MSSDLNLLLEMGFEKERAELAIKKAGARTLSSQKLPRSELTTVPRAAVNQALEWLEKNQDKPLDELQADAKADEEDEEMANINVDASEEGAGAKSLVCNDCGKQFRNADLASYHASKTYVHSS